MMEVDEALTIEQLEDMVEIANDRIAVLRGDNPNEP